MSINTNGFIKEYNDIVENIKWLQSEEDRLVKAMAPIQAEIDAIEKKYNYGGLHNKLKDVKISLIDNRNFKDYYYFRAIVDGLYNLLEKYGWKYSYDFYDYVKRTFNIHMNFEDSFQEFYLDVVCEMCKTHLFQKEFIDLDWTYLVFSEYDTVDVIKIPEDYDIEKMLKQCEDYLAAIQVESNKKEQDEEYKTYLRLKEKYEGNNK